MSRLIDSDALNKEFRDFVRAFNNGDFAKTPNWNDAVSLVGSAPTVDAVPVVRCGDCKHRRHDGYCTILLKNVSGVASQWFVPADDWFCADGERRENDE